MELEIKGQTFVYSVSGDNNNKVKKKKKNRLAREGLIVTDVAVLPHSSQESIRWSASNW